jgi:hypothetical protein
MKFRIKAPESITVKDMIAASKGAVEFVSSMTNQTPEQVRSIPANVFATLKQECEDQFGQVQAKDPRGVTIGEQVFSIIPDFMDFEAGAMIDISEADESNPEQYHTIVLSALFRPVTIKVGERYEVEPYAAKQRPELLDMPLQYYRGAEVFFSDINGKLMTTSLNSLQDQVRKMKSELTK